MLVKKYSPGSGSVRYSFLNAGSGSVKTNTGPKPWFYKHSPLDNFFNKTPYDFLLFFKKITMNISRADCNFSQSSENIHYKIKKNSKSK